ncbi:MAG: MFS transporter [Planctomycetes bacterium]|nr:MFS transporter [Planctomycetota bacterium]
MSARLDRPCARRLQGTPTRCRSDSKPLGRSRLDDRVPFVPRAFATARVVTSESPKRAWRQLALLSLVLLSGMSLWFSASAVANSLRDAWSLTSGQVSGLTMAVQGGFVVGGLVSAILNLPDRVRPTTLIAVSCALGAAANAAVAQFAHGPVLAMSLRFVTGVCLAGVYPPGMLVASTWFRERRGLALGVLVGALTIGTASPHFLAAIPRQDWRTVLYVSSASAIAGAVLAIAVVREGPFASRRAPFQPKFVARVFREPALRLANFGYFGHMWELYAAWTWMNVFAMNSLRARGWTDGVERAGSLVAFAFIVSGTLGCAFAGLLADRVGRTRIAIASLAVSGACCIVSAGAFGSGIAVLVPLALVWGFAIVADSAQFSTMVTELSPPEYVGTALTIQTCVGFLLTMISIRLTPIIAGTSHWGIAFLALVPGPLFALESMRRLRARPEAARLAGGRG